MTTNYSQLTCIKLNDGHERSTKITKRFYFPTFLRNCIGIKKNIPIIEDKRMISLIITQTKNIPKFDFSLKL